MRTPGDRDLVYLTHEGGHRLSYARSLGTGLGLDPCIRPPGLGTAATLVGARRLLFATMEDSLLFFALVALVRDLLRRPTAAIFMNPRTFFEPETVRMRVKRTLAKILNARPRIAMISILPYALDPRHADISRGWMYDPELWDLGNASAEPAAAPGTLAAAFARIGAAPYLLLAGRIDGAKGFDFFVAALRHARARGLDLAFVAAGSVSPSCAGQAGEFERLGGILIDRFLADDEFLALQRSAGCLWACYRPDYNSSSGIFGRAVQLGKRVIVNRDSYLDRLAILLDVSAYRCHYADEQALPPILADIAALSRVDDRRPVDGRALGALSLARLRDTLS